MFKIRTAVPMNLSMYSQVGLVICLINYTLMVFGFVGQEFQELIRAKCTQEE